jgi:hypothetical protein
MYKEERIFQINVLQEEERFKAMLSCIGRFSKAGSTAEHPEIQVFCFPQ